MLKKLLLLFFILFLDLFAGVGKITALKGEAYLFRDKETIKLSLGEEILKNDLLETKKSARLQIFFEDETVVTLGQKSTFKVNDYLLNKDKSNLDFKFLRGAFKVISGKIGKLNKNKFKLSTKGASIGIRGTQILLELGSEKETISCLEGAIDVTILSSLEKIFLKTGESLSLDLKSSKVSVNKLNSKQTFNLNSSFYEDIPLNRIDEKYDEWIAEKNSISYVVEDAFSKGHKVEYNATTLNGTIEEIKDGLSSFDTSNASLDFSIDFGKEKNNNPVEAEMSITTKTTTSRTKELKGNINSLNEIEMTYEVKEGGVFLTKDASGVLKFKNNNLDVEGKDIEVRSYIENEKILINEVELKAK